MKRQRKMLIVMSACLLAFLAVWYVSGLSEENSKEADSGPGEETLWEVSPEELLSVKAENGNGGFSMRWEDGRTVLEGVKELPLDEAAIDAVRACASNIKSQKEIPDGKDRLPEFGLDQPAARVQIQNQKGEETELLLGNPVPGQEAESRYICLKDKVYLAAQSRVECFEARREDFLSMQVTPAYEDVLVTKVVLEGGKEGDAGKGPLTLEYSDSQELAGYQVNSYQITSPVEYPAAAGIAEEWLPSFFNLVAEGIEALFPGEQEFTACGLDTPYLRAEVYYQNATGETDSFALELSRPDGEGNVSVRLGGREMIYRCKASQLPWLETETGDLLSREILAPDIRTLRRLTIRKGGEDAPAVELNRMGTDDAEILHGNRKILPENFRNFYYRLISLQADEILLEPAEPVPSVDLFAEIVFEYENGEKDRVTYYQEAVRQLYAVLNDGERGYRLSSAETEAMLNEWERLLNGEEIKARY